MSDPWYVTAFGSHYNDLYHHRNEEDARRAIDFIHKQIGSTPLPVLDLCCGSGRHSILWQEFEKGAARIVGLDLAPNLLEDALDDSQSAPGPIGLTRGDMRVLPFPDAAFGVVFNLFTSFGYFQDEAENLRVIGEVARVLRPGGWFVFDHINPAWLRNHIVPENTRTTPDGITVREKRWIDEVARRVEKSISFEVRGEPARYVESVRFYTPSEMREMAQNAGMEHVKSFGNFAPVPIDEDSPRAVYFFRKQDA